MSNQPADFFCGDTVVIQATNKPLVDMTISPSLNDYKWADEAIVRIYDPRNALIVDSAMCRIADRVGWYYYRYKTVCECGIGIFRVEVVMKTTVATCVTPDTSGVDTTGTSGTSGDPGTEVCEDIQVSYFRVMSKERF